MLHHIKTRHYDAVPCKETLTPGFPKIDHFGIDARIVLEQNKIQQKVTSNMDRTLDP